MQISNAQVATLTHNRQKMLRGADGQAANPCPFRRFPGTNDKLVYLFVSPLKVDSCFAFPLISPLVSFCKAHHEWVEEDFLAATLLHGA